MVWVFFPPLLTVEILRRVVLYFFFKMPVRGWWGSMTGSIVFEVIGSGCLVSLDES